MAVAVVPGPEKLIELLQIPADKVDWTTVSSCSVWTVVEVLRQGKDQVFSDTLLMNLMKTCEERAAESQLSDELCHNFGMEAIVHLLKNQIDNNISDFSGTGQDTVIGSILKFFWAFPWSNESREKFIETEGFQMVVDILNTPLVSHIQFIETLVLPIVNIVGTGGFPPLSRVKIASFEHVDLSPLAKAMQTDAPENIRTLCYGACHNLFFNGSFCRALWLAGGAPVFGPVAELIRSSIDAAANDDDDDNFTNKGLALLKSICAKENQLLPFQMFFGKWGMIPLVVSLVVGERSIAVREAAKATLMAMLDECEANAMISIQEGLHTKAVEMLSLPNEKEHLIKRGHGAEILYALSRSKSFAEVAASVRSSDLVRVALDILSSEDDERNSRDEAFKNDVAKALTRVYTGAWDELKATLSESDGVEVIRAVMSGNGAGIYNSVRAAAGSLANMIGVPSHASNISPRVQFAETPGSPLKGEDDGNGMDDDGPMPAPPRGSNRRRSGVSAEAYSSAPTDFTPAFIEKNDEERGIIEAAMDRNILFNHLMKEQKEVLLLAMEEKHFEGGDVIIKQGDDGDFFYVIETGTCEVYITKDSSLPQPGDTPVFTARNGDSFGELALMYNQPRAASVIASAQTKTWAMSRQAYTAILHSNEESRRRRYEGFLENVPLLQTLTRDERLQLCDAAEPVDFEDIDIIAQGETGDYFYIVEDGNCEVSKEADGSKVVLGQLQEGAYFGEIALLTDKPRAATVTAIGPVKAIRFDREAFVRLLGPVQELLQRNMEAYNQFVDDSGEGKADLDTPAASAGGAGAPGAAKPQGRRRRIGVSAEVVSQNEASEHAAVSLDVVEKTDEQKALIEAAMAKNILFESLDQEQKDLLRDSMVEMTFKPGEYLIKQGDDGDYYYILQEGVCDIFVTPDSSLPNESTKPVFTAHGGDSFGELALMYNQPRAASVKCVEPTQTWAMSRQAYRGTLMSQGVSRRNRYETFIENVPILQTLNKEERNQVIDALNPVEVTDDAIIVQGDPGDFFYIVESGECRVTKVGDSGEEMHLTTLSDGAYFGEIALLTDKPRAATVTAVGRVKLVRVDRDAFVRLLGPCEELLRRNMDAYNSYVGDNDGAPAPEADMNFVQGQQGEEGDSVAEMPNNFKKKKRSRRISVSAEVWSAQELSEMVQNNVTSDKTDDQITLISNGMDKNILFQHLDSDQKRSLLDTFNPMTFEPGEFLIKQGDDGDYFYIIETGACDIFVTKDASLPSEDDKPVFCARDGDSFGELALMYNQPRAATVVAVSPTTTWAMSRQAFQAYLTVDGQNRKTRHEGFLESVPILATLTREEMVQVADALEPVSYCDEDIIIQGQEGDFFYIIEQGSCQVHKLDENNNRLDLVTLSDGSYFGELALLTSQPRAATVTAVGSVQCLRLERTAFNRLLGPCEEILERHIETYEHYMGKQSSRGNENDHDQVRQVTFATDGGGEGDEPRSISSHMARKAGSRRRSGVSAEQAMQSVFSFNDFEADVEYENHPKTDEQIDLIRKAMDANILFMHLMSDQKETLRDAMEPMSFSQGDHIIRQGDDGDYWYIIEEGECDIFVEAAGPNPVHTSGPGEAFGELALMYNQPRAASVIANGDVRCWAMSRQAYQQILVRNAHNQRKMCEGILEEIPLLATLDHEERVNLADALDAVEYQPGEEIIIEGEVGDYFYIIEAGTCKVEKKDPETGENVELNTLIDGHYFGEIALLTDNPRAASVTAVTRVKAFRVDRDSFNRLLGPCEELLQRNMDLYGTVDEHKSRDTEGGAPVPNMHAQRARGGQRRRRSGVSAEQMAVDNMDVFDFASGHSQSPEQQALITQAMGKNILFSFLDNDQRDNLREAFEQKEFNEGDVIIQQGDDGDYFYVIESGECDIFVEAAGTDPVAVVGGGDAFGELALMYNQPRAATVIAKGPVSTWAMSRQAYRGILAADQHGRRKRYENFLEDVPILQTLEQHERAMLADALEPGEYCDEDIITQGSAGDFFYIIEQGTCIVTQTSDSGETKELTQLIEGMYFGEIALLTDKPRAATVSARGNVRCVRVDRDAFVRILGPVQELLQRNMDAYNSVMSAEDKVGYAGEKTSDEPEPAPPVARKKGAGGRRRSAVSSEAMPTTMDELDLPKDLPPKSDEVVDLIEQAMLRNILFESSDQDQRKTLRDAMDEMKFNPGDSIIKQGDDGDFFYVIDSGSVDIFITKDASPPEEGAKPIVTIGRGASFGELALMYNQPRAATVIAAEPCTCWAMSRKHYRGIVMYDNYSRKKRYEELVQKVPLLENMSHEERVSLADAFMSVQFSKGDDIIQQGEPGDFFYIIEDGTCEVSKVMDDGERKTLVTLESGAYFGELALLRNEPRAATVTAVSDRVKCVRIDRDGFTRLLGPCEELMQRKISDEYGMSAE